MPCFALTLNLSVMNKLILRINLLLTKSKARSKGVASFELYVFASQSWSRPLFLHGFTVTFYHSVQVGFESAVPDFFIGDLAAWFTQDCLKDVGAFCVSLDN